MNHKLIDYRLLRLIVGAVGLTLGLLVNWKACWQLESISHSYHNDLTRDFFVGSLCFIGAFLCVYQGNSPKKGEIITEAFLSKIAGISAIVVAFVPTSENVNGESPVHFTAAAIVFLILSYFCLFSFRKSSAKKPGAMAKFRTSVYCVCGVVMVICILGIFLDKVRVLTIIENTTFWGETIALIAFGIAWIAAGQTTITARSEDRLKFLRALRNRWS